MIYNCPAKLTKDYLSGVKVILYLTGVSWKEMDLS